MSRLNRVLYGVLGLSLLLASVGCKGKDGCSLGLGPDQAALDRERELAGELERLQRESSVDKSRIEQLQNELDSLREQLAARPEPEPAAPGWQNVPGGVMTSIEGTVLFDSGKAVIKPNAKRTLQQIAEVVSEKYPNHDIYVFGHTDNTPIRKSGWKDNYELSAQRALSVVRALREYGVESNMAAAGWGEQLPIAENSSAQARQANRRVEIYAMAPESGYKALMKGNANAAPPTGAGRARQVP